VYFAVWIFTLSAAYSIGCGEDCTSTHADDVVSKCRIDVVSAFGGLCYSGYGSSQRFDSRKI